MSKKLPPKLKIGLIDWKIEYVEDLHNPEGVACWGRCEYDNHRISIDKDATPEHQKEIIVHELTHALLCFFGEGAEVTNERIANTMGKGIPMVLRDNPKLAQFLME